MIPFTSPVQDILFSMTQVAQAEQLEDWDTELATDIVEAFAALADDVIAPTDENGDRQGCRLENGHIIMPDGFKDAFAQLCEGGWQGLSAPAEFEGMEQSPLIAAMVSEIFSGANHSMQMVCNLVPGAISTLLKFGSDEQKANWVPKLAMGEALSTMCLTEPGAGSDLSRIRTKAEPHGDGWRISGEKIFISGGDQDLSEDILHLILARSGEEKGIKGLSLFIAAKSEAGETIKIERIEEKMGLHASPTCQMRFVDAPAQLVGAQGEGLKAMFTLMNHARLDVALQGVAHAARAHDISKQYAAERKQGRNADGTDAFLRDHADVQRMLAEQRCLGLGARAMVHLTFVEMEKNHAAPLIEFLTPLCKIFGTEAGIRAADLGIQILGGYGYLDEYRVSQTWRDARVTSIYEGANGIHEVAIATRGLKVAQGAAADEFEQFIAGLSNHQAVFALLEEWKAARAFMQSSDQPQKYAHQFAALSGKLFYTAAWHKIANVTKDADTANLFEEHILFQKPW